MKKLTIILGLLVICGVANAQFIGDYQKPQDTYTLTSDGKMVKKQKRGLFDRNKSSEPINPKYLAGACPEVNGKIQWEQSFNVPGKSAQQIYDIMLPFLQSFCKGKEMTNLSNVSVVNEKDHTIGARVQEWMVFENKPLSLDQTKFNYQLLAYCSDGKCTVTMRSLSYIYEEERGGGQFPAEDMISDKEALNKKKDGFQRGGSKKFRTKTIDRKDQIFAAIAEALKN